MSINSLELPVTLVAEMYKNHLVEIHEEAVSKEQKTVPRKLKILGENKSHILFVVQHASLAFVNDEELAMLTRMLNACKLSLADVAIVNIGSGQTDYKEMITTLKSRIIFLFGVEPPAFGLPINFPMYQVQKFNNVSFIHAPALSELLNNELEKSKLWLTVKSIFSI